MVRKPTVSTNENALAVLTPHPIAALQLIREELGDCTLCRLHKKRKHIVFGVGNPDADLMFIGEAPGANEDLQGEPFVGQAGCLLNNMIVAMGLQRGEVYIANIVKCRPPDNRTPKRDECETCLPFLERQITVIKPKVIVALGATAARNLLAINAPVTVTKNRRRASIAELRGRFYDFNATSGWTKIAVTYHPKARIAQGKKDEARKDLQQMVMKYLGLERPSKKSE